MDSDDLNSIIKKHIDAVVNARVAEALDKERIPKILPGFFRFVTLTIDLGHSSRKNFNVLKKLRKLTESPHNTPKGYYGIIDEEKDIINILLHYDKSNRYSLGKSFFGRCWRAGSVGVIKVTQPEKIEHYLSSLKSSNSPVTIGNSDYFLQFIRNKPI